ncbi:hypothetical protein [Ideonella livida]|uniref:Uncharacterized protein n=1 Tax=Ideonella livida TaxID=2707176 RepID=A0A7C9PI48_9BURK|nr:hypothetical protein [Ideonella livida]NDY92577.1 hypothetical protein [Ideonella livida]
MSPALSPIRPAGARLPSPCPTPDARDADDPVGYQLGWDHALLGLTPPAEHLRPGHPVGTGWQDGRAALGPRRPPVPARTRLGLGIRLQAWGQGAAARGPAPVDTADPDNAPAPPAAPPVVALDPLQALLGQALLGQALLGQAQPPAGGSQPWRQWVESLPSQAQRRDAQVWVQSLWARWLGLRQQHGLPRSPADQQERLGLAWSSPVVQRRWQRLAGHWDAATTQHLLARARALGLGSGGPPGT